MYNYSTSARILPPQQQPARSSNKQDDPLHFRNEHLHGGHQFYSSSSLYSYTPTTSSDSCPEHGRSHRRTTILLAFCIVIATVGVLSIGGLAAYLGVLSRNPSALNSTSLIEESYLLSAVNNNDEANLFASDEESSTQPPPAIEVTGNNGAGGRRTRPALASLSSDESLNDSSAEFRRYYGQVLVHNSIVEQETTTQPPSPSTSTTPQRHQPTTPTTTHRTTSTTSSSHNYGEHPPLANSHGLPSHVPSLQQQHITHVNYQGLLPFTRPAPSPAGLDLSRLNSRPLLQFPITNGHQQLSNVRATVTPTVTPAPPPAAQNHAFAHRNGVQIDREFNQPGGFHPSSQPEARPALPINTGPPPHHQSTKFIPSKPMLMAPQYDGGDEPWTPLLILRPTTNADTKKQSRLETNTAVKLEQNTPLPHSKEMLYSDSRPNTVVLDVVEDELEEGGEPSAVEVQFIADQPASTPMPSTPLPSPSSAEPQEEENPSERPPPLPAYTLLIPHIANPPASREEQTEAPSSVKEDPASHETQSQGSSEEGQTNVENREEEPSQTRDPQRSSSETIAEKADELHSEQPPAVGAESPPAANPPIEESSHETKPVESDHHHTEVEPEESSEADYEDPRLEEQQKVYRIELSGGGISQQEMEPIPDQPDSSPLHEPSSVEESLPDSDPIREPPTASMESVPAEDSVEAREPQAELPVGPVELQPPSEPSEPPFEPSDPPSEPPLSSTAPHQHLLEIIPDRERPLSNRHKIDSRLEYETVHQQEKNPPPPPLDPVSSTTDYILHSLSSLNLVKSILEQSDSTPPIRSYSGVNQPLRPKPNAEEEEEESSEKIILNDGNFLLTTAEDGSILKKVRLTTEEEDGSLDRLLSMMLKLGPTSSSSEESQGSVSHNVHLLLEDPMDNNTRDQKHLRSPKVDTSFRSLSQGQVPVPLIFAAAASSKRPANNTWTPSKLTSLRVSNSPVYKFVLRRGQTVDDLLKEIFKNYTEKGVSVQEATTAAGGLNLVGSSMTSTTTTTTTTTTAPPPTHPPPTPTPLIKTSTSITIASEEDCPPDSPHCTSTQCTSSHSRCNGVRECRDGADERNCTCAEYMKAQFMERKICDGTPDCADLSDEYGSCPWCSEGAYICAGSRSCIPREKLCDSKRDCPRGDDESDCVKIAPGLNIDNELAPIYHQSGYLLVRKKGVWGKLCVESFNTVLKHWEIKDLARAVCKAKTFGDFESVERVTDEDTSSIYYELYDSNTDHQNTSQDTRSTIGFKLTACTSKHVVRVSCQDLQCGVAPRAFGQQAAQQARIVGGSNALPGEWPWQAALYRDGEYQCGATLISSRWLLSAGHCFYHAQDSHWTARLGTLRRGSTSILSPYEQVIRISHVLLHPQYKDVGFVNDVSLLRLEQEVEFTDFVRPVCLPGREEKIRDGRMCTVVGWGQLFEVGRVFPDTLQEVQLPLISTSECRKRTLFLPLYKLTDQMFCAGFDRGGRDACLGDSGGPLMCSESDGRFSLYGVTSNGYGCARANRPGVYTKVSAYIEWIEEKMKGEYRETRDKEHCAGGFRCRLGECLDPKKLCNGFNDCDGGEDERNCSTTVVGGSGEWR